MKVKCINRVAASAGKDTPQDLARVQHNLDPALHPFEKAVEFTRALNAVKLERVFAKPFLLALPHQDSVECLARNPKQLGCLVAGCADGVVRVWSLPARQALATYTQHTGAVKAVSVTMQGDHVLSCSTDATVRLWRIPLPGAEQEPAAAAAAQFLGKNAFLAVDCHWSRNAFATAGSQLEVWDLSRSAPLSRFQWGVDTLQTVRFNPAEPDLLASTASDRSLVLYDLRSSTPIRKLVMQTRSNSVAWNPMEAFNLTLANEDCSLYTYDIRKLKSAACVHQDFTSAVMSVDYSPTGREFVAGGYDRSVRVFAYNGGHSREVYHTKRMQRVMAVAFSGDASHVFSGSDDMNVRVWKAKSNEAQTRQLPREMQRQAYNQALIKRYRHLPEVKRIERHRHIPKALYKAARLRRTMKDAAARKQERRIAHSRPGSVAMRPARRARIVQEEE